jgi:outer membrane protein assembly factor BamC
VPTLEVPPDLSQVSRDERFLVPDAAGKGSATYSAYSADRTPLAQAQNSTVLPQVDKVRVERSGNQRWLVVAATPDKLWDTGQGFLARNRLYRQYRAPGCGRDGDRLG